MFRFEKLEIWVLSIAYAKKVYDVTNTFPKSETFGLTSQLKRAVLSISSNIAEGCGSASLRDFSSFLDIAIKSSMETVSQLRFAREMYYVNDVTLEELYEDAERIIRKIHRLKQTLKGRRATSDTRRAVNL